ncbi:MAG: hypothetical protein DI527_18200 [Chelatococcus sp.]|nr:MAG: hypothetical protein DI527_18200 [Chelatococcus sp.]
MIARLLSEAAPASPRLDYRGCYVPPASAGAPSLRSAVFIAVEIVCIALFMRAVWIWSALLAGA